jgi:hypothetical protein
MDRSREMNRLPLFNLLLILIFMYHRLIAVTPSQLRTMPWEEVRKTCFDYTVKGLETIAHLPRNNSADKPLRFIYTSGAKSERDPSKKPWLLGDYCIMRVSLCIFPVFFLFQNLLRLDNSGAECMPNREQLSRTCSTMPKSLEVP